jgi:hypothetical protein
MVRRIYETGGEHVVQLLIIMEAVTKLVVSMALLTKRRISTNISSMRARSTHLLRLPNSTPSQIAPPAALTRALNEVHANDFFHDAEVEAAVLALPPNERIAVMNAMADDEM